MNNSTKPIMIIGAGISGMTSAIEIAEVGHEVILIEKEPYLGGRVMRTHRYFPKMCPPSCGFEINVRRIRRNPRIKVYTMARVEDISGEPGNFRAKIRVKPRYVTEEHSIDDSITRQLTSERLNDFNLGMDSTKALYLPHDRAYPSTYLIDRMSLSDEDAKKLKEITSPGSIDLDMNDEEIDIDVAAIIIATGWRPYNADNLDNLGYGKFKNVVTNVQMERLAATGGPTKGKIIRPSDGKEIKNIAFAQCAGSRDENHLPYCSAVCCMGSLKQIRYIRDQYPEAQITMFYIDIRTIGREENFYYDLLEDRNVSFVKGKVAEINEDPETGNLILDVQDTISKENLHPNFEMVVLATGVVPNTDDIKIPYELQYDQYGFIDGNTNKGKGIFAIGCAKRPCDVSRAVKDATSAALKAIQSLAEGGQSHGR